jgi:hypothetical protein
MEKYCKIRERWDKYREIAARRLKWILNSEFWILNTEYMIYPKNSKLSWALLFCLRSKVWNWKRLGQVMEWHGMKSIIPSAMNQTLICDIETNVFLNFTAETLSDRYLLTAATILWISHWILIAPREPARCDSRIQRMNNKCLYHFHLFRSEQNHSVTNPAAIIFLPIHFPASLCLFLWAFPRTYWRSWASTGLQPNYSDLADLRSSASPHIRTQLAFIR